MRSESKNLYILNQICSKSLFSLWLRTTKSQDGTRIIYLKNVGFRNNIMSENTIFTYILCIQQLLQTKPAMFKQLCLFKVLQITPI